MFDSWQLYNNFKVVEADLILLLRYIDLDQKHYKTTSAEIRKIILSTCSLIELSYPLLLNELNSSRIKSKKKNESLASNIYNITLQQSCPLSNITPEIQNKFFTPWTPTTENRDKTYKFDWWDAYIATKHVKPNNSSSQILFFKSAIDSICALFSLTVFITSKIQINSFWHSSDFIKIRTIKYKPLSIYNNTSKQLRKQIWPDYAD